jgi:hypothetical protein
MLQERSTDALPLKLVDNRRMKRIDIAALERAADGLVKSA